MSTGVTEMPGTSVFFKQRVGVGLIRRQIARIEAMIPGQRYSLSELAALWDMSISGASDYCARRDGTGNGSCIYPAWKRYGRAAKVQPMLKIEAEERDTGGGGRRIVRVWSRGKDKETGGQVLFMVASEMSDAAKLAMMCNVGQFFATE